MTTTVQNISHIAIVRDMAKRQTKLTEITSRGSYAVVANLRWCGSMVFVVQFIPTGCKPSVFYVHCLGEQSIAEYPSMAQAMQSLMDWIPKHQSA